MRPRTTTLVYQTAARSWLTLAGGSILLSAGARRGIWLPLHLTLAGAVSVAIAGAMQNFTATLTATGAPPNTWTWTQFATMNAGVALIALGRPLELPAMVAVGGTSFVLSAIILLAIVWRASRRSLLDRHRLPVRMYGAAVCCVILGGTFGALMGSEAIHSGTAYVALLRAHMTINVLGWVSLTIVATLVTLLPTTLRIKMPAWHGTVTAFLLGGGAVLLALGLAFERTAVVALGGACVLLGALGAGWMVSKVIRTPRRWPIPVSAMHLLAGFTWFLVGSVALAISALHGVTGVSAFFLDFLTIFVGGWIVQVLLGAWSFLLPMARPGHPDTHRAGLIAIEFAGSVQLICLNVGVALMALRAAGWVGEAAGSAGVRLALLGAAIALAKVWAFPALASWGLSDHRGVAVWGRPAAPGDDAPAD
jgi:nitrite reductase (NO-forming)